MKEYVVKVPWKFTCWMRVRARSEEEAIETASFMQYCDASTIEPEGRDDGRDITSVAEVGE